MKNVHILPTDNYSPLVYSTSKYGGLFLSKYYSPMKNMGDSYQHIYITSNSEIKQGDWALNIEENTIFKPSNDEIYDIKNSEAKYYEFIKKIIMTTDQDLIKDGVQAIDDTFLEWFVKNPSCEEVEVDKNWNYPLDKSWEYKIITPKEEQKQHLIDMMKGDEELGLYEEPKQETLEEAAKNYSEYNEQINKAIQSAVKFGAKWQQEKMYSDMQEYAEFCIECDRANLKPIIAKDWFEQFKKK